MKEIINLNKRIRKEASQAIQKNAGVLLVFRRDERPKELLALPGRIQIDLKELRGRLDEVIPDDFGYVINFGDSSPALTLLYSDGAQTETSCPVEWDENHSILEQLAEMDWSKLRQRSLRNCQSFDRFKEALKDTRGAVPSTKALQDTFRAQVKAFVKTRRKGALGVRVLMVRDYEGMEAFRRQLPDIMTLHGLVVAAVAGGKELSVGEIDKLKRQALKELEGMPISRASALGAL
jgi:hypothetical protein